MALSRRTGYCDSRRRHHAGHWPQQAVASRRGVTPGRAASRSLFRMVVADIFAGLRAHCRFISDAEEYFAFRQRQIGCRRACRRCEVAFQLFTTRFLPIFTQITDTADEAMPGCSRYWLIASSSRLIFTATTSATPRLLHAQF